MADFTLKKGSTQRSLRLTVSSSNTADDLSGVTGGKLYMWLPGNAANKINGEPLNEVAAVSGSQHKVAVRYDWEADDVDTAGMFAAYVKLEFGGGKTDRFPSEGYFTILIEDNRE
jgi:hypothetical protein